VRRLWLVGIKRGRAGACDACRADDHEHCAPVPVAVDQMGVGVSSTGYVECRCLCMPAWMQQALDNGWVPPERPGDGNRRQFYEGLALLEPRGDKK
jgi:hypothetical protein